MTWMTWTQIQALLGIIQGKDKGQWPQIEIQETPLNIDFFFFFFFATRVVTHWNKLPRETVELSSKKMFKTQLDGALSSLFLFTQQGLWSN